MHHAALVDTQFRQLAKHTRNTGLKAFVRFTGRQLNQFKQYWIHNNYKTSCLFINVLILFQSLAVKLYPRHTTQNFP